MSYSQVRGFLLVFVICLHSPLIKPFVSEEADIITVTFCWYLGWQECVKTLCSFFLLSNPYQEHERRYILEIII